MHFSKLLDGFVKIDTCTVWAGGGGSGSQMPMEGEASPGAESEARRAERGAEPQFTSGAGAAEGLLVRSPLF